MQYDWLSALRILFFFIIFLYLISKYESTYQYIKNLKYSIAIESKKTNFFHDPKFLIEGKWEIAENNSNLTSYRWPIDGKYNKPLIWNPTLQDFSGHSFQKCLQKQLDDTTKIAFFGDSRIRQLYRAFIAVYENDYDNVIDNVNSSYQTFLHESGHFRFQFMTSSAQLDSLIMMAEDINSGKIDASPNKKNGTLNIYSYHGNKVNKQVINSTETVSFLFNLNQYDYVILSPFILWQMTRKNSNDQYRLPKWSFKFEKHSHLNYSTELFESKDSFLEGPENFLTSKELSENEKFQIFQQRIQASFDFFIDFLLRLEKRYPKVIFIVKSAEYYLRSEDERNIWIDRLNKKLKKFDQKTTKNIYVMTNNMGYKTTWHPLVDRPVMSEGQRDEIHLMVRNKTSRLPGALWAETQSIANFICRKKVSSFL